MSGFLCTTLLNVNFRTLIKFLISPRNISTTNKIDKVYPTCGHILHWYFRGPPFMWGWENPTSPPIALIWKIIKHLKAISHSCLLHTFDALIGCGTTNIPADVEGNEGKCGWLEGGEAELDDSGLWDTWWLYSPDISWSWSNRPPSDPDERMELVSIYSGPYRPNLNFSIHNSKAITMSMSTRYHLESTWKSEKQFENLSVPSTENIGLDK